MSTSFIIRHAELNDLDAITEIYNEAILTTTATFDNQPKTQSEQLNWFNGHDQKHPMLVAVLDEKVVGWVSLSKWSDRCAYSDTGEVSFYVKSEFRGQGIGRNLLQAIIEQAQQAKFHTLLARIAEESHASLHLFQSSGFFHVGMMKEVGRKFDKLLGVYILQKMLEESSS
jgi:L-amino acid N-acyltransferase